MTARSDVDRLIATWLTETAPEAHVDYLDQTLEAIEQVSQRPAWTSPGRWLPMQLTLHRVAFPRALVYVVLIALLIVATVAGLLLAGPGTRYPPPFGLAGPGLVAFASGGDILVARPDGSARRTLLTGLEALWSPVWSHRGDRIAYWSAPAVGDPASLWVATADGSNRRLVTGSQTFLVPDALPAVAWSPDDGRLAFASDEGVLYLAGADGSGVRPIGDGSKQRFDPVWSPDGTLIAYRGQPPNQPYLTTSSWVITPDGLTESEVIPTKGQSVWGNFNPSWSLQSDAIVVHDGTTDSDISIARRDASGSWSHEILVPGSTEDGHPAWSNSGKQISFLRLVPGTSPEVFVVMVVNTDGTEPRPVSDEPVGFAAQCWLPNDQFIRAVGPSETDPTILLIPLDGSRVVTIPAPDHASRGVCGVQRIAP